MWDRSYESQPNVLKKPNKPYGDTFYIKIVVLKKN